MSTDHLTPEVRALIGVCTDWTEAPHAIETSEVRRFIQASMLPWPAALHGDGAPAVELAPLGFLIHMFRQPMDLAVDPLDAGGDAEFDGRARRFRFDLPAVPITLAHVVNGGYAHEFYSHARVGERIQRRSRYKDISQREGRTGPMVMVVIEDEYRTMDERPLQRSTNTHILR